MELRYETLSPSEAAAVTGVSNAHQISARKSGLFQRPGSGHMRWDISGIARLGGFKVLSERGFGPKQVAPYLDHVEDAIYRHLLLSELVYDANALRAAELVWDVYIDQAHENPGPESRGVLLRRHALQHLSFQVTGDMEDYSTSNLPIALSLIVIWPDGEITDEDWDGFKMMWGSSEKKRNGAIVVLSVFEIAEMLAKMLPKPLICSDEVPESL